MTSSVGRKYWRTDPAKERAHQVLKRAIRRGDIIRPTVCSNCPRHDVRIIGHHNDYTKPLEVEWLCEECHSKIHLCLKRILKLLEAVE